MKQSLCQNADDPQPKVVNRPHVEARTRPEPEITSPNLAFMFKARFRSASQIYRVSQDLRNCGASV